MLKVYTMETSYTERHADARLLLKWKYEELFHKPLPEILVTEKGKPYLADGSCFFSFSYTDGICCCALSDSEVGVDVEQVRSVGSNTIPRVLSRREWMQYSAAANPAEHFMRCWTLKEAYCKFTGQGISVVSLRDVEFDLSSGTPLLWGRDDLRFWSRCVNGLAISVCTASWQKPELYHVEI